MLMCSTHSLV